MAFFVFVLGAFVLQCALCYWGQVFAAERGINPWIGFVLALLTPLGILVLLLVPRPRHRSS